MGFKVTAAEKQAIKDLARQMGYPNAPELIRDALNLIARRAKR